jgi:hypothetical protein
VAMRLKNFYKCDKGGQLHISLRFWCLLTLHSLYISNEMILRPHLEQHKIKLLLQLKMFLFNHPFNIQNLQTYTKFENQDKTYIRSEETMQKLHKNQCFNIMIILESYKCRVNVTYIAALHSLMHIVFHWWNVRHFFI